MLIHFHIDLEHFNQLNSLAAVYLGQLKLVEKARFAVNKIAMEKARLNLHRLQPCIFCSTSHLVMTSSSEDED